MPESNASPKKEEETYLVAPDAKRNFLAGDQTFCCAGRSHHRHAVGRPRVHPTVPLELGRPREPPVVVRVIQRGPAPIRRVP